MYNRRRDEANEQGIKLSVVCETVRSKKNEMGEGKGLKKEQPGSRKKIATKKSVKYCLYGHRLKSIDREGGRGSESGAGELPVSGVRAGPRDKSVRGGEWVPGARPAGALVRSSPQLAGRRGSVP